MSGKEAKGADCVVTGELNGKFVSVLLRDEKSRYHARAYGERKGWKNIRVIQALAFMVGAGIGIVADRAQAAPVTDAQQYAMVLTASEIMEQAQCGMQEKPITFSRLLAHGIDVKGRDNAQFLVTMDAIAKIYLSDPKGFCRRAQLSAGR